MELSALAQLNDFRSRILRARKLEQEGRHEEAAALSPTVEELREGLLALRANRTLAAESSKQKKTGGIDPNMNLMDLFAPKDTETPNAKT